MKKHLTSLFLPLLVLFAVAYVADRPQVSEAAASFNWKNGGVMFSPSYHSGGGTIPIGEANITPGRPLSLSTRQTVEGDWRESAKYSPQISYTVAKTASGGSALALGTQGGGQATSFVIPDTSYRYIRSCIDPGNRLPDSNKSDNCSPWTAMSITNLIEPEPQPAFLGGKSAIALFANNSVRDFGLDQILAFSGGVQYGARILDGRTMQPIPAGGSVPAGTRVRLEFKPLARQDITWTSNAGAGRYGVPTGHWVENAQRPSICEPRTEFLTRFCATGGAIGGCAGNNNPNKVTPAQSPVFYEGSYAVNTTYDGNTQTVFNMPKLTTYTPDNVVKQTVPVTFTTPGSISATLTQANVHSGSLEKFPDGNTGFRVGGLQDASRASAVSEQNPAYAYVYDDTGNLAQTIKVTGIPTGQQGNETPLASGTVTDHKTGTTRALDTSKTTSGNKVSSTVATKQIADLQITGSAPQTTTALVTVDASFGDGSGTSLSTVLNNQQKQELKTAIVDQKSVENAPKDTTQVKVSTTQNTNSGGCQGTGGACVSTKFADAMWAGQVSAMSSMLQAEGLAMMMTGTYRGPGRDIGSAYGNFTVAPPVRSITKTTGLTNCTGLNTAPYIMDCTVSGNGPVEVEFSFAETQARFWGYVERRAPTEAEPNPVPRLKGPSCGNGDPGDKFGTQVFRAHSYAVPAQKITVAFNQVVGRAPTTPVITGPTTGAPGTAYTFGMRSTDPDGDAIRYGIDWNGDNVVDEWVPASGRVPSGTIGTVSRTWPSEGPKTFRVLAEDASLNKSGFGSHTITLTAGAADLVAGGVTPTTAVVNTPVSLRAPVTNRGNLLSGAFPVLFQIGETVSKSSGTIPGIPVAGVANASVAHTFTQAGTYQVRACANKTTSWANVVPETNYDNNCGAWTTITVKQEEVPTTPTTTPPTTPTTTPPTTPTTEPTAVSCTVSNTSPTTGETVTYRAANTNGSTSYTWTPSLPAVCETGSGSSRTCTPTAPGGYDMQVVGNRGGTPASCPRVTVGGEQCADTPRVTITASANRVVTGREVTLNWSAVGIAGVSACTISGPGLSVTQPVSSCQIPNGSRAVTITTQSTYRITCGVHSASVLVNVIPNYAEN